MGDSLLVLSYHETGMGTPDDLKNGGLGWRVQTYYDMAQGGACANGFDAGSINTVGAANFSAHTIPMSADLDIATLGVDTANRRAEIAVTVHAKSALPEGVVLNVLVSETHIDWLAAYDFMPMNAQAFMYDVACGFITDSLGFPIAALAAGGTAQFTGTATYDAAFHNPDSLRITAILQVAATREILSLSRTSASPFPAKTSPIVSASFSKGETLRLFNAGTAGIGLITPFADARVAWFDASGKCVGRFDFAGTAKSARVTLARPAAAGLYVLTLVAKNGAALSLRVPLF